MAAEVPKPSLWRSPQFVLPLVVVLLHLACVNNYGYFRDELYYLACARRLDWGYVDHPPFSVALLAAMTRIFGESLLAVRAVTVAASGVLVWLVVDTARRVGATGWGLWLAGVATVLAGMYLVIFSFTTMNGLDIVLWALIVWLLVPVLQSETGSDGRWVVIGLAVAAAFLNKASVLWLVAGFGVGVLLSPQRRLLASRGPWIAVAIAALAAVPHLQWQAAHGWPTTEFATNARNEKLVPVPVGEFFGQQAVVMGLVSVPLILAGIVTGFTSEGRKWRAFSVAFLVVLAILLVNGRSRVNYLAPAYPLVLATGAAALQKLFERRHWRPGWLFTLYAVTSPLYLCLGLPWLSPATMTQLISLSPVQPPVEEVGPKSPMQGWADMFGWKELATSVSAAQSRLSKADQERCAVVTKNYGEAAALEHYGLRRVLSGHNTYWIWGPQDWDGTVAVFVNEWPDNVKSQFESFEQVGSVVAPNAVPEQNGSPVWVARGLKVPVKDFWAALKVYR